MGFGGGGDSGSLGVSAHLHTNNIGDGGSLNNTSLINDTSLFSVMVALG
jgi:hypothetical protein|tara:strand:+ start:262 stop:408 length:147 start_codon:yes stop_codon:yes gene_type:complete